LSLEELCKTEQGELANVSLPGFTPAINYCFGVHILLAEACYNVSDVQCVLLENRIVDRAVVSCNDIIDDQPL
jgi:hypothetical protein